MSKNLLLSADEDGAEHLDAGIVPPSIEWFLTVLCLRLVKMCFEDGFENSKQVLGSLKGFSCGRPQRNPWAFGSGGRVSSSAPSKF